MRTVISHRRPKSNYTLKEDKSDLIFINGSYNLVDKRIAKALANAIKTQQVDLNSASTTNITGRIIPKHLLNNFTSTSGVKIPRLQSLLMHNQWIKGGVVKVALAILH